MNVLTKRQEKAPAPVNSTLYPDNGCFGCGLGSEPGLGVEIRESDVPGELVGTMRVPEWMTGFPGIAHGAALFAALDCLAVWVGTLHRDDLSAIWVLRGAEVAYHRPAPTGAAIALRGQPLDDAASGSALAVGAEARDSEGRLLVEGTFTVVPVAAERLREVLGIDELPAGLRALLARRREGIGPGGCVVGLDRSSEFVIAAQARMAGSVHEDTLEIHQGDAHHLPPRGRPHWMGTVAP
jgi:acyl-coenzyme A thioesterase PaaI-like protein